MTLPTNIPYRLIGGIVAVALAIAAVVWLVNSRDHWRDQAGAEKTAHETTVTNYRTAAETARKLDAENKARVEAEQRRVNERTALEYEARIASARATYERLRAQAGSAPGGPRATPVPVVPNSPSGATPAPAQGGLPLDDALTATEQAIQLDQLIRWVNSQAAVPTNEAR